MLPQKFPFWKVSLPTLQSAKSPLRPENIHLSVQSYPTLTFVSSRHLPAYAHVFAGVYIAKVLFVLGFVTLWEPATQLSNKYMEAYSYM